jgi:hypothetical protein
MKASNQALFMLDLHLNKWSKNPLQLKILFN